MSASTPTTRFVSRGRLNGVLRERGDRPASASPAGGTDDLDTEAYEAIYYRARLILGEALPRPARLRKAD
jgi:hypothetical protein